MTIIMCMHLVASLAMCGVIWFVQLVHYPLFLEVGHGNFSSYHREHVSRTTRLVAPLMGLEALSGFVLLFLTTPGLAHNLILLSMALLAVGWISTFAAQVPGHRMLTRGYEKVSCSRLVRSNWIRTFVWSARALVLMFVLGSLLHGGNENRFHSYSPDMKSESLSSTFSNSSEAYDQCDALLNMPSTASKAVCVALAHVRSTEDQKTSTDRSKKAIPHPAFFASSVPTSVSVVCTTTS